VKGYRLMKLLIAEDEIELSNALVEILKHNNYSIDAVYDGNDAYDYIISDDYDAIILDIMMPGIDGITVLKKIREKGITTPVLFLTAKSEIEDRVTGLDFGADDYVTKPFSTKELLARIRAITRRINDIPDNIISIGNIKLDRAKFILYSDSESLRLANKEYQLMETLMLNYNKPLSTEKLMEKIWGYDSDAEINVVWSYICCLRKKLTSINSNLNIKVMRNLGYALEIKND
jgi:DNA-binding response OmpR family regulator